MLSQLEEKNVTIDKLKKKLLKTESMLAACEEACLGLQTRLEYVETKLKVYDAFFRDHRDGPRPDMSSLTNNTPSQQEGKVISDVRRLNRLQQLSLLEPDSKTGDDHEVAEKDWL
jgi:hypothetical protein